MDVEEFRKAGHAAIDSICDYYTTLHQRPVKSQVSPGYLLECLPHTMPKEGEKMDQITKDFQDLIMPGITHWQHGKWFAYFPTVSTFESILGELYSASVSNPGFNWICSPACTELEQVTVDWSAELLGLHPDFKLGSKRGGGLITGSASESCLTAAMAARERALQALAKLEEPSYDLKSEVPVGVREKFSQKLVMYGSTHTHSVGAKAAVLLGLLFRAVHVSEKEEYGLRGDALKEAIEKDRAGGLIPFFVVATIGTTSSGAIDFIGEMGQVVKQYPTAFLYVDAAWAGVAFALPAQREKLRVNEVNQYADFFCTNMHKWGLVGFDCSLFFVRDRTHLTDAFDVTPAYLRSTHSDAGTVIDFRNWQIALGRRFRSIKLWFVLRSFGQVGFQNHLQKGIDLCARLAPLITCSPIFELVTPPVLALAVFRLIPPAHKSGTTPLSDPDLDALNRKLHIRLDGRSDVMLTPTVLPSAERSVYCLRFSIGSPRTTWEDVKGVWEIVEAEGEVVLREWEERQGVVN